MRVANSSEKYAACGPYIRSWPTLTPSTIASQISTGSFVCSSSKNGYTNSSVKTAPAMYSLRRPTRSDNAP